MKISKFLSALAIAMVLMFASPAAQASIVCSVKNTPDGFVALRKFPMAGSLRLYKLRPWHKVELRPGGTVNWAKVIGPVSISSPKLGYVRKTLIYDCG